MRRFWIKFDVKFGERTYGVFLGCGVTAESREDALRIAEKAVFRGDPMPRVLSVVEDVDVSTLDANHVMPNIGDPDKPGVWYPALNVRT